MRNDPILHIELRRWDMLAKIVSGMADGLLASVVRAWDMTGLVDAVNLRLGGGSEPVRKRIVVMNTAMSRQLVTVRQIGCWRRSGGLVVGKGSQERWFEVLRPQEKELAVGVGDGAMKDWKEIVTAIEERLGLGSGE